MWEIAIDSLNLFGSTRCFQLSILLIRVIVLASAAIEVYVLWVPLLFIKVDVLGFSAGLSHYIVFHVTSSKKSHASFSFFLINSLLHIDSRRVLKYNRVLRTRFVTATNFLSHDRDTTLINP